MIQRPRRNRKTACLRDLVRENQLNTSDLVLPLFLIEGSGQKSSIAAMPGVFRYTLDLALDFLKEMQDLGIRAIAPFPAISDELKDKEGTYSWQEDSLFLRCIRQIKEKLPELLLFTDVALDPYSSDGHDGYVEEGRILNDKTLALLSRMAVAQAKAGADFIAPSDMMDGRVGYLRKALDEANCTDTGILAYTAKYASSFYGPFREALDSAPRDGDKKTYQMDSANSREALRELKLDLAEGADMVMVKPGLPYLDIVRLFKERSNVPVAVYNVSGEYAMLRAAAEKGWLDYQKCVTEALLSFKRAGADIILTYHAAEFAGWQAGS